MEGLIVYQTKKRILEIKKLDPNNKYLFESWSIDLISFFGNIHEEKFDGECHTTCLNINYYINANNYRNVE